MITIVVVVVRNVPTQLRSSRGKEKEEPKHVLVSDQEYEKKKECIVVVNLHLCLQGEKKKRFSYSPLFLFMCVRAGLLCILFLLGSPGSRND